MCIGKGLIYMAVKLLQEAYALWLIKKAGKRKPTSFANSVCKIASDILVFWLPCKMIFNIISPSNIAYVPLFIELAGISIIPRLKFNILAHANLAHTARAEDAPSPGGSQLQTKKLGGAAPCKETLTRLEGTTDAPNSRSVPCLQFLSIQLFVTSTHFYRKLVGFI